MLYELASLPSSAAATATTITHHQPAHHQFQGNPYHGNRLTTIQQKDYSRPLHVDCSVEYELPSQVKPPPTANGKMDPLLMIHPCYFRKIEAQRRSPFINNLPGRGAACPTPRVQRTPKTNNPSCSFPGYMTQWHPDAKAQLSVMNPTPVIYNNRTGNESLWSRSPLAGERFPELVHATSHQMTPGVIPGKMSQAALQNTNSGKYRQYLRTHRLHPYAAFPQMQQIPCYNV